VASGLQIVNGDFVIGHTGAVEIVEKGPKCLRDFGKMLQTSSESSDNQTEYFRYNPTYGSLLDKLITHNMSKSTILEIASSLLYATIQNYLELQETRDNLTAGEIIIDVNFDVNFDVRTPGLLVIPMSITTSEGVTYNLGEFEQRFV